MAMPVSLELCSSSSSFSTIWMLNTMTGNKKKPGKSHIGNSPEVKHISYIGLATATTWIHLTSKEQRRETWPCPLRKSWKYWWTILIPDPGMPMSSQESPAEAWVSSGLLQAQGPWGQQACMGPFELIFITSTTVWPQVKQQGGNTAPPFNRRLN